MEAAKANHVTGAERRVQEVGTMTVSLAGAGVRFSVSNSVEAAMRNTFLGIAVVASLLVPAAVGLAQSRKGGIFWAPTATRQITVTQNGATVASLMVPADSFMSASYDDQQQSLVSPGRWQFKGDVVLRIQPVASAPPRVRGNGAEQVMINPPVTLTVSNVDVLVTNVNP
jgi:hypothetical protein